MEERISPSLVDEMSPFEAIFLVCLVAFGLVMLVLIVVCVTLSASPDNYQHESEMFFRDPSDVDEILRPFPSLRDKATLNLSVVVPAYNEQNRLPPMLDECLDFLEDRLKSDKSSTYEVIIVDDGSNDGTSKLGLEYSAKWGADKIRVLTSSKNRGKGGAVKMGMLKSRGAHLLFADADGATKFSDLTKLEAEIGNLVPTSLDAEIESAIVVGSRAHLEKESIAKRSLFRTILMYGFHTLVWLLCVRRIRDTQCGFKLLTRAAARQCFPNLHIHGWAFDVELLYIAETLKIPVAEVAVVWTEIDEKLLNIFSSGNILTACSKIVPFWSWVQMGKDIVLLWFRYKVGAWCIDLKRKVD